MQNQNKIKLQLLWMTMIVLVGFGYAVYFLWGKVVSAKADYIESYKELLSLEKKQEQIIQLQEELAKAAESKEEITSALLAPQDVLNFIMRIEDTARKAGLSYDVRILGEITEESIEEEMLALRRSRRKLEQAQKIIEEKLPGIMFNVGLEGSYSGVVRFLEGVASLPYYTHIENFNVSRDGAEEELQATEIKASVQMTVFTHK